MTRATAIAAHERRPATVLELDIDTCTNTYGIAPCTAAAGAGNECYNCWATCQDKANFTRGTQTVKFISRGVAPPAGETILPYIESESAASTEIDPAKGLAARGQTRLRLADEPGLDILDPYRATRATPAGGTFWQRFQARHPNAVGRTARVRRGFVVAPWDWAVFTDETYQIESIKGPGAKEAIDIVLVDAIKLLDRRQIPAATDGKLATALTAYSHVGVAQAGSTGTTIVLANNASAVDDAYNGQEIYCYANTGAGQRRTITDYEGATRTATVGSAWSVTPDTTTAYQVSPLSLTLETGKGAQYNDPAVTGRREFVVVKDEVIEYTAIAGDVLSWPDATYREQFNTTRPWPEAERDNGAKESAKVGDRVQQCLTFIDEAPADVLERLFNLGGVVSGNLDTAGLADEAATWLSGGNITTCLTTPEQASTLIASLLRDLGVMAWWDAPAAKVRFKADTPVLGTPDTVDDNALIAGSLKVDRLDDERITRAAMLYDLASATAKRDDPAEYLRAETVIDADAESAAEFGDVRDDTQQSRWLSSANATLAASRVARRVAARRNAPTRYEFKLDWRDELAIGDLVDLTTRDEVDAAGNARTVRCRVVKVRARPEAQEVCAVSTVFGKRYAFIAPNGYPNYTAASEAQRTYAFIATTATGLMSNGDDPYRII